MDTYNEPNELFPLRSSTFNAVNQKLSEFISLLRYQNLHVRNSAIENIVHIGNPAIPRLINLLYDDKSRETLWESIIEILARIGEPAIPFLINILYTAENEAIHDDVMIIMTRIGNAAINPLVGMALNPASTEIQYRATRALSRFSDPSLRPVFRSLLQERNDGVRKYAALGLGRLASSEDTNILLNTFNNEDALSIRMAIINALANTHDSQAMDTIIRLTHDHNRNIQLAAIRALSNFTHPRVIQTLKNILSFPDEQLQNAAIESLANIGIEVIPYLFNMARQENAKGEELHTSILEVFLRIGENAIHPLLLKLHSQDVIEQELAFDGLAKLGPIAVPILTEVKNKEYKENIRYQILITQAYERVLKDLPKSKSDWHELDEFIVNRINTDNTVLSGNEITTSNDKIFDRQNHQLPFHPETNIEFIEKESDESQQAAIDLLKREPRDIIVDFPDKIVIDEQYDLTVNVIVLKEINESIYQIFPYVNVEMEVHVFAPYFEIINDSRQVIKILPGKNSELKFHLIPKNKGKRQIQVTFYQNGNFLGIIGLTCEVDLGKK